LSLPNRGPPARTGLEALGREVFEHWIDQM
jgi:hypothetical protein